MKLSEYVKARANNSSELEESKSITQILTGGQDVSKSRAYELREAIEVAVDSFDDETIMNYPELCPRWESGKEYEAGTRVQNNGVVYIVLQSHTSQDDWKPEDAVSLFSVVLTSDTEILEWVQPDSTNAYMKGDKVLFNGLVYTSKIDNNVWSPSAYPDGWELTTE